MTRPNNKNRTFHAALGLVLAIALGGARTEKIWAEALGGLDRGQSTFRSFAGQAVRSPPCPPVRWHGQPLAAGITKAGLI
jgi:hypothetical protein